MPDLNVDAHLLRRIEKRLKLRDPNYRAIDSVAKAVSQHYDVDGLSSPYECIVDSATGVGKTYVMAGLIEYFAGRQTPARNFLLLAPGRTIRDKSIQNFKPGHRRSLTGDMESRPFVVDADNFTFPSTRAKMADPTITKLYVFTVQALTSADGEGRATHEYQEVFGGSFFEWLAGLDDLVLLADEQHCYRGPAFSKTIKDLNPEVVIGLTATPHDDDEDLIVFRYPLAKAIAEEYVKTPSLVARRDDRKDDEVKLLDGVTLLRYKERIAHAYCRDHDLPLVNPVMLVIASNIADAERFRNILDSESFDGGAWIDRTLLVHSKMKGETKEQALADLEAVEDPNSRYRIIISVGMLKEGWDVKNVYVIASMRPSISDVLTEQTLGRGMRLPFGKYTGDQFLDTVEVIAHERYQQLLDKRESLNEKFIDYSIYMETRETANGTVARPKVVAADEEVFPAMDLPPDTDGPKEKSEPDSAPARSETTPVSEHLQNGVQTFETYLDDLARQANEIVHHPRNHTPLSDRQPINVPYVEKVEEPVSVSLNQIDDEAAFSRLGAALTNEADTDLKRTLLKSDKGRIKGVRGEGIAAGQTLDIPLESSREMLIDRIMRVKSVRPAAAERRAAGRLVDLVIAAMGDGAGLHLSAFIDRAARRLGDVVSAEIRKATKVDVTFSEEVRIQPLDKVRTFTKRHEADHTEDFDPKCAYNGWRANLYAYATFDTSTEYTAAGAIDDASSSVVVWARLHRNDIPITWTMEGRVYNPDFVVIENETQPDGSTTQVCWLVETKQQRMLDSTEVAAKRKSARTWARTVNNSGKAEGEWRYLLLGENDVRDANGNWAQMKDFGQ